LAKPDAVNGPPRYEAKTKGEANWRFLPERPQFVAEDGVGRCLTTLGAAHVHGASLECDRRPLEVAQLRYAQAVPEADQDHGRIALAMAVALGHLDQALDLELGEVLAIAAHVTVAAPAQCDCP
jgi:hypothetical protein